MVGVVAAAAVVVVVVGVVVAVDIDDSLFNNIGGNVEDNGIIPCNINASFDGLFLNFICRLKAFGCRDGANPESSMYPNCAKSDLVGLVCFFTRLNSTFFRFDKYLLSTHKTYNNNMLIDSIGTLHTY